MTRNLSTRLAIVLLMLGAGRFAAAGRELRETPLTVPLSAFPLEFDDWRGVDGKPFGDDTLQVLGVDDHLNRVYENALHQVVGLYVGFYRAQRHGDSIHSPRNCLPGSGWQPVSHSRPVLNIDGHDITFNRYVVERRGDRLIVLYWFQGRGRTTASEYQTKAYLLYDALRLGRTDGAVVRLIAPVMNSEDAAEASAQGFSRALVPQLTRWLP